jgi:UDP-apiose/xylose synthase
VLGEGVNDKKRVLCVGGGGFIGSNLCFALEQSGDYTCTQADIRTAKLKLRFDNQPFAFVPTDITRDHTQLDELIARHDIVFNLASIPEPKRYILEPLDVVNLNLFNGSKVIDGCVRHRKYLIHFSTSEVYGKSLGSSEPFREDETNCVVGPIRNHRWIYSCTKQLIERLIHAYGLENRLNYTIVRPFNVVGPLIDHVMEHADDGCPRVFAHFISALMNGEPMRLVDGGRARRTFLHVDDLISAIQVILKNRKIMNREIVNIGNPDNEIEIRELAESMSRIFWKMQGKPPRKSKTVSVPAEEFYGSGFEDTDRRMPDISKLMALGWAPKIGLEQLLKETIAYTFEKRHLLTQTAMDRME